MNTTPRTIASRNWTRDIVFHVANLKGPVGDWGYTTDSSKAIHLSPYWQRRFAADCRAVGVEARFLTV